MKNFKDMTLEEFNYEKRKAEQKPFSEYAKFCFSLVSKGYDDKSKVVYSSYRFRLNGVKLDKVQVFNMGFRDLKQVLSNDKNIEYIKIKYY